MKKADFIELFGDRIFPHLKVTFVVLDGKKIGYLEGDQIKPIPTTKKGKSEMFKYFVAELKEVVYPQFSKGGKYKKHYGDAITIVQTCTVEVNVYGTKYLNINIEGFTQKGRKSNSYVISTTDVVAYKEVDLFNLKIKSLCLN